MPIVLDKYLGGAVHLQQSSDGLKAGLDAVLLAASLKLSPHQRILDLGSGCFQLGLFLLARQSDLHVTGIEFQASLLKLSQRNIKHANKSDACNLIQADINSDDFQGLTSNSFDHVISNPPYFDFIQNSEMRTTRHAARHLKSQSMDVPFAGPLLKWLKLAKLKLKFKGQLTMSISDRQLAHVLTTLKQFDFGNIEILPLFPTPLKPATRFLIAAKKCSNSLDHTYGGVALRDHKRAINPLVSQIASNPTGVSWSTLS